jgi:choline dehydrogenase-like flavoprotein
MVAGTRPLSTGSPVIVIGSGAAGGTVAHELTMRGVPVLMLEAGKRHETESFIQDEGKAYAQLSWLDQREASGDWLAGRLQASPTWTCKGVGGSTLHWNAIALRLQAHEFRPLSTYGPIAGADLIDWPITLNELAPYYARAEVKLGVTGTNGIAPHPPTNNYKVLWNGAKRIGYRDIRNDRLAINVESRDGRAGCVQFGFCNQGCLSGAKWSTLVSEIPKAEATGRLELRTEAMAVRVDHDARGRAAAVVYRDAKGVEHRVEGSAIVLACNAVETARLLLMSTSGNFPNGLANGSGLVGRHFMRHTQSLSFARFDKPVHMQRGIVTPGMVYDEARHDPNRGFPGGYLIQAAAMAPASVALLLDPGGWGKDYAAFIESYDHLAGALLVGEDLPRSDNRVSLHETKRDANSLPVPVVHVDEHDSAAALRRHGWGQAQALFEAAGAREVRHGQPPAATHNLGTARMSARPVEGVVNRNGEAHDVPGLFIADGSVFPSSGAENPTLTIVALAIRQAEHIAIRLKRGELA